MMISSAFRTAAFASVLALGLSVAGCDNKESKEPADKTAEKDEAKPAEDKEPAEVKDESGDTKAVVAGSGEQDRYEVNIEKGDAKVGEETLVKVTVVPQGGWHMNLDYPTSLEMEAPNGVDLVNAKQEKDDALKLDDESAEYGLTFTASEAGDKDFKGKFKFAVCADDACQPITEDIDFKVAVK